MASARSSLPLVATALLMLWVLASAASRGQGFVFFAAGLPLVALAWIAFYRGRRTVLYRLWYVLLLAAAAAGAFELLLHVYPKILRGAVANVAYTGYHWQGDGIYRLDAHRGPVMRPSFARSMYWNGHWWWHETNADGYRGPRLDPADVVFLGDSMIYGHGVEADQTVPARFQARSGLRTANLGQQGTSLIQALLTFLDRGRRLRPRLVFVSSHPTDLEEALRDYGEAELRRFVATPVDAVEEGPWVVPEYRPRPPWDPVAFWSLHVALPWRSSGILGAVARSLRGKGQVVALRRDPFVPTAAERAMPMASLVPGEAARGELAWRAHLHALGEIKRAVDGYGGRLVVLDVGYPDALCAAVERAAGAMGIAYSPAGRQVLERSLRGERMYLADDGHWSPEGADAVAAALLSWR